MTVLKAQILDKGNISEYYKQHGFVSLKNILDLDLLKHIGRDLNTVFQNFVKNSDDFDSTVINLNKNNKELLHKLHIASSGIISFNLFLPTLKSIIYDIEKKDRPIINLSQNYLLSIPNDKRLVYDFHQESNFMTGFGNVYNVHYPLFRTSTVNNGTMSVLDRSHLLGNLPYNKKKLSNDSYTDLIPEKIDSIKNEFQELHIELECGDCFIFHQDLIHKSNYNSSKLTRPVGIFRLTTELESDFEISPEL